MGRQLVYHLLDLPKTDQAVPQQRIFSWRQRGTSLWGRAAPFAVRPNCPPGTIGCCNVACYAGAGRPPQRATLFDGDCRGFCDFGPAWRVSLRGRLPTLEGRLQSRRRSEPQPLQSTRRIERPTPVSTTGGCSGELAWDRLRWSVSLTLREIYTPASVCRRQLGGIT